MHFIQQLQTVDILLLQSSNVLRKSMSIHALTDLCLFYSWRQSDTCICIICKPALFIMYFTFGSLLACLKFVESVSCSLFQLSRSHFEASLVSCIVMVCLYLSRIQHYYLQQHACNLFTKCLFAVILQWIHTLAL